VTELALNDVDRDALARELDGVRVAELMWRKPPPDTGIGREVTQLGARGGDGPRPAAGRSIDYAEQRSDWQRDPVGQPRVQLLKSPLIHAGLAPLIALAMANQ